MSHAELRKVAEAAGVEFVSGVPPEWLDAGFVEVVPVEWARTNLLLPVRYRGGVGVLTTAPADIARQEYLALLIGHDVVPVVAPREVILQSIEDCYVSRDNSTTALLKDLNAQRLADGPAEVTRSDDLLRVAEKAPVTQLVNLILLEAVKRRASDIHVEPFEDRLRMRYRVDGILYEQASPPKHLQEAFVSRLKVMAHMDIAEKRLPQDGMARVSVGAREIDIRVSTVPVAEGERVVLRLLDRDQTLLPLTSLGMAETTQAAFGELLKTPHGMLIVCGPTGSGKTTTLYAALGQMDAGRRNILTIEDPIEYRLPGIGQIQVKPKIGLTFAVGLRHVLRQDPDIILVGETRDLETAEISIRSSLTGHLVFTTLHTNDAPGAIVRLVDMGLEPFLLAACVRGVLAQRLVRKLCPVCRRAGTATAAELAWLPPDEAAELTGRTLWHPAGCPACLEGFSGRTGLFELMPVGGEIQAAIRCGGAGVDRLRGLAEAGGMRSLRRDGLDKALAGQTSLFEVASVAG